MYGMSVELYTYVWACIDVDVGVLELFVFFSLKSP